MVVSEKCIIFVVLKDGKMMVNATQMGKAFGKKPSDWLRTEQANRVINAVSASQKCEPNNLVVVGSSFLECPVFWKTLYRNPQEAFQKTGHFVRTYSTHSLPLYPITHQCGQQWHPAQVIVRLWLHVRPMYHPSDNIVCLP